MGITLADAIINITGDDGPLGPVFNQARAKTDSFVSGMGKKILTIGSAAMLTGITAVATGVIGIGVASFNTSSQIRDATNLLQTQLGITEERAEELGDVIKEVYGNNFGDSIEEVGAAVGVASQNLERYGDIADSELSNATQKAFALEDAFDVGINESTDAAAALMNHLGLSADEAMNFISRGLADASINNEDFVDTIREYSNQFGEAGFSASDFYNILAAGSESGVLGTDKIADAFKEMNIRLAEGGNATRDAFAEMGLDYDAFAEKVSAGETTWADQFDTILEGLVGIEDPLMRAQAQTAIFGTMAEDLGVSFTDGLIGATDAVIDFTEAGTDLDAQYNSLPAVFEGIKRKAQLALAPIGDVLLDMAMRIMPLVTAGFEWFEINIIPMIERGAEVATEFMEAFFGNLEDGQGPIEAFKNALAQFIPPETMAQITPVIDGIQQFISKIQEFVTTHSEDIKAALIAIGAVLAAAGIVAGIMAIVGVISALVSPIGLVVGAVALLGVAWNNNWGGIRDFVQEVAPQIQEIIQNFLIAVQDFWTEHGEAITEAVSTLWTLVSEFFNTNLEAIKELVRAFIALFQGDWEAFADHIYNYFKLQIEAVVEFFGGLWEMILPWLTSLWEGFTTWFDEMDWGALADSIIQGIVTGLENGAAAIAEAARAAAAAALEAAKEWLGIDSPSKVMAMQVGLPASAGIAQGMELGMPQIKTAAESIEGALDGLLNRTIGAAIMAGAGSSFTSQDNFQFDVSNARDAELAARLAARQRSRQLRNFADRGES